MALGGWGDVTLALHWLGLHQTPQSDVSLRTSTIYDLRIYENCGAIASGISMPNAS